MSSTWIEAVARGRVETTSREATPETVGASAGLTRFARACAESPSLGDAIALLCNPGLPPELAGKVVDAISRGITSLEGNHNATYATAVFFALRALRFAPEPALVTFLKRHMNDDWAPLLAGLSQSGLAKVRESWDAAQAERRNIYRNEGFRTGLRGFSAGTQGIPRFAPPTRRQTITGRPLPLSAVLGLLREDPFRAHDALLDPAMPASDLATVADPARFMPETVKFWVALNPSTPPDALRQLAQSRSINVRAAVAANPNTPTEVLATLAESTPLRSYVLLNPASFGARRTARPELASIVSALVDNRRQWNCPV